MPLAPEIMPVDSTLLMVVVAVGLLLAAAGNGFMQPACYAGVRKFSDESTAAMGYGLLYAGMNLGIVFIGFMSSRIRTGIDLGENLRFDGFGIEGVMWFCVLVNVLMLFLLAFSFLGIQVLLGGMTLFLIEREFNSGLATPLDGMWMALVTLTTVGYGDFSPQTTAGKIFTIVYVLIGLGILVSFLSAVAGHAVQARLDRRGRRAGS